MNGSMIELEARDGGSFGAYLSQPAAGPAPAVIILPEIFGITPWIKTISDQYAEQGYLVCAPEVYWRLHPGFVANEAVEAEFEQAFAYRGELDRDQAVEDLGAVADQLRAMPECTGKVAMAGFCLGGTLAYLSATRLNPDAAVIYYGTQVHEHLDEAGNVGCPTLVHIAEQDPFVAAEHNQQIQAALAGNPHVTIHTYDTGHGFANADNAHNYAPDAAALAHRRSFDLLEGLK